METFEYSKSQRRKVQRQKAKRVIIVAGAGLLGATVGFVADGEGAAALFWVVSSISAYVFTG